MAKLSKTKVKAGKLNARDYKWTPWARTSRDGAFDFLKKEKLPVAVKDVFFDEDTFEEMEHGKNGMCLTYYSSGRVTEYAAVLCDDGDILFCIVSGHAFAGTFATADNINMQYYKLTAL